MSTFENLAVGDLHHLVKIPRMPKGVEHSDILVGATCDGLVKIPRMPKGVEHHCTLSDVSAALK